MKQKKKQSHFNIFVSHRFIDFKIEQKTFMCFSFLLVSIWEHHAYRISYRINLTLRRSKRLNIFKKFDPAFRWETNFLLVLDDDHTQMISIWLLFRQSSSHLLFVQLVLSISDFVFFLLSYDQNDPWHRVENI